jgi:hypothetical protein
MWSDKIHNILSRNVLKVALTFRCELAPWVQKSKFVTGRLDQLINGWVLM